MGVLITGDSGTGKSELALDLISRGHTLVADDAPDMTVTDRELIVGTCPELLAGYLDVRGLGVLDVRAMFGVAAVKTQQTLNLIIHLQSLANTPTEQSALTPLHSNSTDQSILGVKIPKTTLLVAPGRNLAILLEAAVHNYRLKLSGVDAANEFINLQRNAIKEHLR